VKVTGLDGVAAKATKLSVGATHACALLTTGGVRCWGLNSSGQLGDNTVTRRTTPVDVKVSATVKLTGVKSIASGAAHNCALVGTGAAARVRCWGADNVGQQGTSAVGNARVATLVSGTFANGATSVATGASHSLVLAPGSTLPGVAVVGWGINTSAQLGDGSVTSRATPVRPGIL
jgi:alpha-tubulin suppressor-like RCC1 family protein